MITFYLFSIYIFIIGLCCFCSLDPMFLCEGMERLDSPLPFGLTKFWGSLGDVAGVTAKPCDVLRLLRISHLIFSPVKAPTVDDLGRREIFSNGESLTTIEYHPSSLFALPLLLPWCCCSPGDFVTGLTARPPEEFPHIS